MKKHKKDPLYKSFGYAFQGIYTCISKERNMKIHCCVSLLVVIAGHYLSIVSDRMVYLSDIVWTCDGIGAGEHIDRGSGGSCNRGAKAFGEDCQGYGGRSCTHCSYYGSDYRLCYFCSQGHAVFDRALVIC